MCKKLLDSSFNQAVINKISNFNEIAPNLQIYKIRIFKSNWNFLDQPLLLYKFYGRDM